MHHGIGKCNPPADGLFHMDAEDAQEVSSSATDGMDADGPEVSGAHTGTGGDHLIDQDQGQQSEEGEHSAASRGL